MNLSAIRLVVTDIDGTLLDSRHKLSNDFYPTFSQLKSKGILFSAASGRQQFNLQKRFEPIVEDVIFISENGSYVVYRNEELLVQSMPAPITRQLLTTALGISGAYPSCAERKKAYVQHTLPEFIANVELYYEKYEVVPEPACRWRMMNSLKSPSATSSDLRLTVTVTLRIVKMNYR